MTDKDGAPMRSTTDGARGERHALGLLSESPADLPVTPRPGPAAHWMDRREARACESPGARDGAGRADDRAGGAGRLCHSPTSSSGVRERERERER